MSAPADLAGFDPALYPYQATIGPVEPGVVLAVPLDADPLPFSGLVISRFALALREGLAIRLLARDPRILTRVTAALNMLAGEPAGGWA